MVDYKSRPVPAKSRETKVLESGACRNLTRLHADSRFLLRLIIFSERNTCTVFCTFRIEINLQKDNHEEWIMHVVKLQNGSKNGRYWNFLFFFLI